MLIAAAACDAFVNKPITAALWISINGLLSGCQPATRPGAEVRIGVDDAVAVLILERGEDGDASDPVLAGGNARPFALAEDCDVAGLHRDVLAHYDADRDDMLDADELGALQRDFGGRTPRGKPRQLARLERIKLLRWVYDANADRALDADEWRTLRDDLGARCLNDRHNARARRDERAQRMTGVLARFDANHDGRLDTREQAAARDAYRQRIDAHWQTLIDRFDTDGNRLLDSHERAALREYERSVVRGERVTPLPGPTHHDDAGSSDAAHAR